jgi:aminoglycoside phosphotransferase (APT) family kinase protein
VDAPNSSIDEAVDREALRRYMDRASPEHGGQFEVERLGEGQSCLTFLIRGDGWELVLRRPPRGDLPPTAFDVTREFRVMSGLDRAQAAVPVPKPLALCEDRSVIGAPFYLMERVPGHVVRGDLPPELCSVLDRGRMGRELVRTLLGLHSVDYRAAGLETFGKPAGYLERQLLRMSQLWQLARFRDIPEIEGVGAWLGENLPQRAEASIVHGDFKLDNVIFDPDPPATIAAVIDWEMSTLGDPLADLGWMLYFWRDPGDPALGLRIATVTDLEGFPRRHDLLSAYATEREVPDDRVNWYVALAGWKIAIIMEGSYRRYLAGITDHPAFAQLEAAVPALARRAQQAMNGSLEL